MAGDGADLAYLAGELEDPRVVTVIEGAQAHGFTDREEPLSRRSIPNGKGKMPMQEVVTVPPPKAIGGQGSTPRH